MNFVLSVLLIVLVALLFFSNIYYRIRLIRIFKRMKNTRVTFEFRDLYFRGKRDELISRYPEHEKEIRHFAHILRTYSRIVIILIIAIIVLAVFVFTTK